MAIFWWSVRLVYRLVTKLKDLGLDSHLCNRIPNFLTARPQMVWTSSLTPSTLNLSLGAPQGYMLSPLRYKLFICDCIAQHPLSSFFKFGEMPRLQAWSQMVMKQHSEPWLRLLQTTTFLCTSVEQRRWLFRKESSLCWACTCPLHISGIEVENFRRWKAALNSLAFTFLMTSNSPPIFTLWWEQPAHICPSCRNWDSLECPLDILKSLHH